MEKLTQLMLIETKIKNIIKLDEKKKKKTKQKEKEREKILKLFQ